MVKKRILISLIALFCVAAILAGVFYIIRWQQGPVKVVAVNDIFMTGDDYGSTSTGGTVIADRVQSAFLTTEDKILEIPVSNGQEVQKGDLLIRLDTSLSQLQIARQKLTLQKQQMTLDQLNREYTEICRLKPYTAAEISRVSFTVGDTDKPDTEIPETELQAEDDLTGEITEDGRVEHHCIVSGSGTLEDPYLCLVASGVTLSSDMIDALMGEQTELYIIFLETEDNAAEGYVTSAVGSYYWRADSESPLYFGFINENDRIGYTLSGEGPAEPEDPDEPTTEEPTTDEPTTDEPTTEEPSPDEPTPDEPTPDEPDPGPMYTAKEIADMKTAKLEEIRDAEINLKLCEVELKRLESIQTNEGVIAQFSGVVTLAEDIDDAIANFAPVLKLSGIDGGYYVEGALGEFALNTLSAGQEVTVNSWMTGESYIGTVSEISDRPSETQGWTNGNPNITYYGFSVRLDASASLTEGDYVDILLPSTSSSSSFYLQKPFILRESGKSYVYLEKDGCLYKQEIITGRELWGEYLEILNGVSLEDFVAFPYGKNIREGIKTEHTTLDSLYGY